MEIRPSLESYALKILSDHNCDCYTYGDETSKHLLDDLKEGYPDGMLYPYVDVANAILAISRPCPIVRKGWAMFWDNDQACDAIFFDSFEAAKDDAEDTLIQWMIWEREEWSDMFDPTDDELDSYNYMICNCFVEVRKYNPDTDEYEEYWGPSYEDEEALGWKELTREDLAQQKADWDAGVIRPVDSSSES